MHKTSKSWTFFHFSSKISLSTEAQKIALINVNVDVAVVVAVAVEFVVAVVVVVVWHVEKSFFNFLKTLFVAILNVENVQLFISRRETLRLDFYVNWVFYYYFKK